ncbi:chromodomain-helicase-DNA-binding protein 3-like [Dorcoceras hygrometricum]|uniref:Chromodomain-helicase-DNA-binding protein 3-like n=1 Tax=Dorcoceras hygrometricum TaxID=472368 RepID=A0A2Z7BH23_9LAMI|nr:chromodomain-helicase-DNA-binding protein 3-like [Dorcoceras hygrometricum]
MSLFDLQDVCIAIGSIATLDLPMVVDLIGIYGLKGPYCTLTMTDWFLQALLVIPKGSWGDVSIRFTMIRWAVLAASPPLSHKPPPPPEIRFRPIRRGESVRAEFVSASSAGGQRSLGSGRGPDWRFLPQSTEKIRRYCNYGWGQAQVPARPPPPPLKKPPPPPPCADGICSGQLDEENPLVIKSISLLVQSDRREIVFDRGPD